MSTNTPDESGSAIAFRWWRSLNPAQSPQSGRQRAALARMRRAATPLEVMQEPEALRLITVLPHNPDKVAMLAGVLAFVRESDTMRVARAIGRKSLDDDRSAILSESRFRRLLQAQRHELMDHMRRLVKICKYKVNVYDLSDAVLYWSDPVRKRWIFNYYSVAAGDPSTYGQPAGSESSGFNQRRPENG